MSSFIWAMSDHGLYSYIIWPFDNELFYQAHERDMVFLYDYINNFKTLFFYCKSCYVGEKMIFRYYHLPGNHSLNHKYSNLTVFPCAYVLVYLFKYYDYVDKMHCQSAFPQSQWNVTLLLFKQNCVI